MLDRSSPSDKGRYRKAGTATKTELEETQVMEAGQGTTRSGQQRAFFLHSKRRGLFLSLRWPGYYGDMPAPSQTPASIQSLLATRDCDSVRSQALATVPLV